ncbi:hypothetical protein ACJX0J_022622, partial [Zea mays]
GLYFILVKDARIKNWQLFDGYQFAGRKPLHGLGTLHVYLTTNILRGPINYLWLRANKLPLASLTIIYVEICKKESCMGTGHYYYIYMVYLESDADSQASGLPFSSCAHILQKHEELDQVRMLYLRGNVGTQRGNEFIFTSVTYVSSKGLGEYSLIGQNLREMAMAEDWENDDTD